MYGLSVVYELEREGKADIYRSKVDDETLTPYNDNVYVETSKSNTTTYENSDDLKVGGNTYTK